MPSIFATDQRTIARQYFFLSLAAVLAGTALSLPMCFHLVWPQTPVPWFEKLWPVKAVGGVMTPEFYLSLRTLHGPLMVFFVLTLAPMNAFGYLVEMPLMQMPLTCWNWFVSAILSLLSFPVRLAAAGLLILLDRHAGTSFSSRPICSSRTRKSGIPAAPRR